jgi:signal transduction histidine kinase
MDAQPSLREQPLILVVDDDPTQRILVQEALEAAGFDTDEAENGKDGIAKTADLGPDLVILDVMMPDLDGFAVCEAVRKDPGSEHIPILIVTGLEDDESIEQAFDVGATNFLVKPINWALLGHQVRYVLRASETENELRAATLAAEAATRAKSQLLANMSHELRTPLNAVIGFAEFMADEGLGPLGNPGYLDCAKDIKDAGKHLLSMINDLLDLSRIEAGKAELREDIVELRELVEVCLRTVMPQAKKAALSLDSALPAQLPGVKADERKLRQMVLNLLSNAIKFTPANGRVELTVFTEDGGDLIFQVRDNGIGIAPADVPRALETFSQVDGSISRKYGGTGLGLPLTRSLVELHGGRLELESALGEGTTVCLRLPAWRVVELGRQAI